MNKKLTFIVLAAITTVAFSEGVVDKIFSPVVPVSGSNGSSVQDEADEILKELGLPTEAQSKNTTKNESVESSVVDEEVHIVQGVKSLNDGFTIDITSKLPLEFINTYTSIVEQAIPDIYNMLEDNTIKIAPLDNDIFYERGDYNIISLSEVDNATMEVNGNEVTVIPNNNFNGQINIKYIASNKDNKTISSEINIRVKPLNDIPVANKDILFMNEDDMLAIPSLVENDVDVDGDHIKVIDITEPANGVLDFNNGQYTYTPNENFAGVENLKYKISDIHGAIARSELSILVRNINDAPTVVDDEYSLREDGKIRITNLLENDSDADNDLFFLTKYTKPSYGTIKYNGRTLTYIPEKDFHGVDEFSYTVSDTKNKTSKGSVKLVIRSINDEPVVANDGPYHADYDTPMYMGDVFDNDSDVDEDKIEISTYTNPLNGYLSYSEDTGFLYIPNPGFIGRDVFAYTITDGKSTSDLARVDIVVGHPNASEMETKELDVSIDEDVQIKSNTTQDILRMIDSL